MDNSTCVCTRRRSSVDTPPLMAATVPTFIKTGVSITPWTVSTWADLALPHCPLISYFILAAAIVTPFPLLFLAKLFLLSLGKNHKIKPKRSCDTHGRPSAGYNTHHQGQGEISNGAYSEDVKHKYGNKGSQ